LSSARRESFESSICCPRSASPWTGRCDPVRTIVC